MIGPTCPECGWVHDSDWVRALYRFDPTRPTRYAAKSGGPIRATREQAEADECKRRRT